MVIDVDKMQQRLNLPSTRLSCIAPRNRNLLRGDLLSDLCRHATDLKRGSRRVDQSRSQPAPAIPAASA